MKKFILLLIATLSLASDTKEILELINILKQQKIEYKPIKNLYDPFCKVITIKKNNVIIYNPMPNRKKSYHLEIIFQNKVRINGKWYKNNDKIDKYIIVLKNDKVYLKYKNKLKQLKRETIIKVTK